MLSIKNLNKTYANGVHATNNVNLEIPNGLFGLLGPNGAGKSSLMRTIATLQEPDSGTIHFNGLDVLQNKEELRRQLGYLPQDFGVYPKVSAEDLLNHFAVLKGITNKADRKQSVEALLRQTNLWEARKRGLGTYSGGMRQRFGIAQALLGSPKLVIVDEPTAGLDPDERNRFLNLLSEIGEQVVVILSTHIVEDVTDLCPRMAMIAKGQVLVQGEPQAAIETLQNKVWRCSVSKEALPSYLEKFTVLTTRLVAGKPQINVYSESQPDEGFRQVEANLEDVYFLQLRKSQNSASALAV
ncbi:ABC transporter ATP-binding protein [Undibacterium macrobrachii]|jgi:ABC-type multidrug transport system ATPase subunit|uniref:Multidrug ABC transporter ATP-binding protein n=1 Tax=Undibacterium macrobrachii TaxID=1119058 RepID=A0ABQ2XMI5_9BURK|nr:ABC transporter ATP-binding protein [Undibacterium macrobrachii]GGX24423.1 multidrug ABC transporter ATP-binding protein [Undibacterium macrobrachii]